MKLWKSAVLTGAISLCTLVSNAQSEEYDWDYSSLDSTEMANIKKKEYPYNKNSEPTKFGINAYVQDQKESVIFDFQNFFKVPIYSMDFEADDLSLYSDDEDWDDEDDGDIVVTATNIPSTSIGDDLGIYWVGSNYATISNEEKYLGYNLKNTKKYKLSDIVSTNKFVRGVMLHELGHDYIKQLIDELRSEGYSVNSAFTRGHLNTPYSTFLEEGISEYCPTMMGEVLSKKKYVPKSIDEMFDPAKKYQFYYVYSVYFVKDFLNEKGFKNGIRIMLCNPPPTSEEILKPELYFSRLKLLLIK